MNYDIKRKRLKPVKWIDTQTKKQSIKLGSKMAKTCTENGK